MLIGIGTMCISPSVWVFFRKFEFNFWVRFVYLTHTFALHRNLVTVLRTLAVDYYHHLLMKKLKKGLFRLFTFVTHFFLSSISLFLPLRGFIMMTPLSISC